MKNLFSLFATSLFIFSPLSSHATNEEGNPALLDIMPGNELSLAINFPKSVYQQNPTVVFRNGAIVERSTFNPYNIGEFCEIYFKNDPTSWFNDNVNINRKIKIKNVNEAWSHSPGSSNLDLGDNYRTGNNIWLEDESIQRISCFFVEHASAPLTDKEIDEIVGMAKGKSANEIAFLAEEKIHYRLSLNHLKQHLGPGLVALNNVELKELDYWDRQSRNVVAQIRKEIKAKGRKQWKQDMDELEKLADSLGKLMKIEGAYRRAHGMGYDQTLDENQNYQKYLLEEIEKQNFPEDIRAMVNDSLKRD